MRNGAFVRSFPDQYPLYQCADGIKFAVNWVTFTYSIDFILNFSYIEAADQGGRVDL